MTVLRNIEDMSGMGMDPDQVSEIVGTGGLCVCSELDDGSRVPHRRRYGIHIS